MAAQDRESYMIHNGKYAGYTLIAVSSCRAESGKVAGAQFYDIYRSRPKYCDWLGSRPNYVREPSLVSLREYYTKMRFMEGVEGSNRAYSETNNKEIEFMKSSGPRATILAIEQRLAAQRPDKSAHTSPRLQPKSMASPPKARRALREAEQKLYSKEKSVQKRKRNDYTDFEEQFELAKRAGGSSGSNYVSNSKSNETRKDTKKVKCETKPRGQFDDGEIIEIIEIGDDEASCKAWHDKSGRR